MSEAGEARIGIVVIGRNEGERLAACLQSLGASISRTVYVDSGSSDGSLDRAQGLGAMVTALDLGQPFTAARARNAGFAALMTAFPHTSYVQFIDGDCTLDGDWLDQALACMDSHADMAVVCGRRRERYPERSVYNQLCDWEWDSPVGEATECGGDIFVRVEAFRQIGGYAEKLIAGEEPDMCVRLRENNWRIWRIDAEMSLHDANILQFGQWWQRTLRGGHAFAEVSARHARSPFRIWHRNTRRALVWGLAVPAVALLGALLLHPAFVLVLLTYPVQIARLALRRGSRGWRYAFFMVLGKFPELQGMAWFYFNRVRNHASTLIEYK